MNGYSIALFLHIVGALGLFVALGLEWTGLWQIRNAMAPEQVRGWMMILKGGRKFGLSSMLATIISGIYMMVKVWGTAPWIVVTIGSLVLVMALAQVLTSPRMMAVGQALAAGKGALTEAFHSLANDPVLWISIQTRVAIALGIVFLKVARPGYSGSLLTIVVAIILGIASVLSYPRSERVQEGVAK